MQDIAVSSDYIKTTLIPFYSKFYDVSPSLVSDIVACESGYNASVRGDLGHSRGAVQISDIYHPEITDVEAFNAFFSINYLTSQIAKGNGHQWSCYRQLVGNAP